MLQTGFWQHLDKNRNNFLKPFDTYKKKQYVYRQNTLMNSYNTRSLNTFILTVNTLQDKIMAQKITLSIPDLLHEKLKEWRDSFNFSKMFQEAVTDAIQKKEEFQKRFSEDFDMPDIINRLKQEKLIWEKNFYKSGKSEGHKWARSAHFEDLLYVLNLPDTYQLIEDPKYQGYFEEIYDAYELANFSIDGAVAHEKRFVDGWFAGVNEFWNQVKEQI